MKPFEKILAAVDFSEPAAHAVEVAAELSRRYDAPLTVVHVHPPVAYTLPGDVALGTPTVELLSSLERRLSEVRAKAEAAGGKGVRTFLLQGHPATEIAGFASAEHYDLVVMGTHGRTGVKHLILGSVAAEVARTAPCPVLTVKAPPPAS